MDPYDTAHFDVATTECNYQWAIMAKMADSLKQLMCTVDTTDQLMNLFKDRQTHISLGVLLRVPTAGNGKLQSSPRTFTRIEQLDANLQDFNNVLGEFHSVSLLQFCA